MTRPHLVCGSMSRERRCSSWFIFWLHLASAMTLVSALPAEPTTFPAETLCVATYNLRFAGDAPPNAWPDRRPLVVESIRQINPDILGTQEGLFPQLKDLSEDLSDYAWIGLGRDGGSRGEFMAVFYRTRRLTPLEFDHFWLSDTPNVVASRTWGHDNVRMVTWIRFQDRRTSKEFYLWNTHLDHAVQTAREKGAALIWDRVAALDTSLPVILTGDFNAVSGQNPAYDVLVQGQRFADTWHLATQRRGEGYGSFNGFKEVPRDGRRIDWILLRGQAEVFESELVPFQKDGAFASDHFPVVTRLRLK